MVLTNESCAEAAIAWTNPVSTDGLRLDDLDFEYTSLSASVFGDIGVVYSAFRWKGAMDGQAFSDSGFIPDFPLGSIRVCKLGSEMHG